MKCIFKLLTAICALNLANAASDNLSIVPPNTNIKTWEQHPEGIAVAIFLTYRLDHESKKETLRVYIKNTSDALKKYTVWGPTEGINVLYIDDHGNQVPIYNYNQDVELRMFSEAIKPNAILSIKIDITSEELGTIKAHPVLCSFVIYDPTTKQKFTIKTSPKLLTEVANVEPSK